MEFLASDDALDLPDRIEEVNAKRLDAQINEKTFIAVLFRKNRFYEGKTISPIVTQGCVVSVISCLAPSKEPNSASSRKSQLGQN